MVVVSHLFLFLWKSFRGRFDSYKSNLPLFGTIISRQPHFRERVNFTICIISVLQASLHHKY